MADFRDIFLKQNHCVYPKHPSNNRDLISSDEIIQELIKYDSSKKYEEKKKIREKIEEILLGAYFAANDEIIIEYGSRLNSLANDDTLILNSLSGIETLNSSIHHNILCLVGAILKNGPKSTVPNSKQKLHNWLRSFIKVNETRTHHFFSASFLPGKDLFSVKVSKSFDDTIHEAFVGFHVGNVLRKIVPNFVYTYGYTKCSPFSSDKSWCDSTEPAVSYLITENIKDSEPLGKWFLETNSDDFLSVFLQLINALNSAYLSYRFVHHNLNSFNVVVRTFPEKVGIPIYNFDDSTEYGVTISNCVPYIIGTEYSEFLVSEKLLRNELLEILYPRSGFPMIDLYVLLISLKKSIIEAQPETIVDGDRKTELIDQFFEYFMEGSITEAMKKIQATNNYRVANIHRIKSYAGFFTLNEDRFKNVLFKNDVPIPIDYTRINPDEQIDTCNFINKFRDPTKHKIRNSLEYITTIDYLQKIPDTEKMISEINLWFNSDAYFKSRLREMLSIQESSARLSFEVKDSMAIDPDYVPPSIEEFYNKTKTQIQILVGLKSKFYQVKNFITVSLRAFDLQGLKNDNTRATAEILRKENNKFVEILVARRKDLGEILNYIDTVLIPKGEFLELLEELAMLIQELV